MKPTQAVLLAAGRGTRMGTITQTIPKPMVHVHGKPVLEHILVGLRDFVGIRDFFIITSHLAHVIENHFQDGSRWQVRCSYGRQSMLDGTGKAPELAREWVKGENFFLSYGDILIDPADYYGMAELMKSGVEGIISVKSGENVSLGGAVRFDHRFFLQDILEKSAPHASLSPWLNAGVYILTPALFTYTGQLKLSQRGEYELPEALSAMAHAGLLIKGYEISRRWADVRDPKVLEALNRENQWAK